MRTQQEWNAIILAALAHSSSASPVPDEYLLAVYNDEGLTAKILDSAITSLLNEKKICFCRIFKVPANKWLNVMYLTGCDPSAAGSRKAIEFDAKRDIANSKRVKRKCKTCSNHLAEEKFIHGSRRCVACVEKIKLDKFKKNSTKRCYTCRSILPLDKFNLEKSTKRCLSCMALFPTKEASAKDRKARHLAKKRAIKLAE